jgi:citrate lyase subunit beta/citryl-CoA lyase
MSSSLLAEARSFLFVPGNRPERFDKALASPADGVIVDLEDAVPAADKVAARAALASAWPHWSAAQRARLMVRINAAPTNDHQDDLAWLHQLPGLPAVMLPKAENVTELSGVQSALKTSTLALIPIIESAEGLANVDALARCPSVLRLAFGNLDFQADLGMACGADEAELAPARFAIVLASRRAGLAAPIDGVTTDTKDMARVQTDAARSLRFGFGAKLCIHPLQVAAVHSAFAPTAAQIDWAQRVLQAEATAGGGAFTVDGRMVDPPVLKLARQCLAMACTDHSPLTTHEA